MNIWYVHPYSGSPSDAEYGRAYFLSSALIEKNISCRVITASTHHLLRTENNQRPKIFSKMIIGVPYTWIKTPKYVGNGLSRIINMIAFGVRFRLINLVSKYDIEKPDTIILSSAHPFHILGGIYWANKYGAKLIFEVRDIWPLSLIQLLGLSKKHPLSLILGWLEKKAYNEADQIVSLLPNALAHMVKKGLCPEKFNYIPNGINRDIFNSTKRSSHHDYICKLKEQGAFVIIYTGAHGVPNYMEPLIEAANIINNDPNSHIQFVLIGDGVQKKNLIKLAVEKNISNVHFLDSIPRAEIPDTLKIADIVFIGGRNIPLYEFGVSPNKMFEYMLASKPILMTISSPNNPLELSQAGTCIGSNDPKKIADEILKFSSLPSDELESIGNKGKVYVEKYHLYNILAQKYLDVINK